MAKFILEVSDGYIKERCDIENITKLSKQENINPLSLTMDFLAFMGIEDEIQKGKNEFIVSSSDIPEEALKIFNNTVSSLAALAIITKQKVKK